MSKTAIMPFLIILISCFSIKEEVRPEFKDYDLGNIPYKLYAPDAKFKLHWDLEEISGLSYYKDNKLLAIEDETGNVYLIDAAKGEINRKIKFEKAGDYEGVEVDDELIWVMASNGTFYSFEIEDNEAINIEKFESEFTSKNDLEGLAYNKGSLIIAAKGEGFIKGVDEKGKGIYEIKEDRPEPLFFIQHHELKEFIKGRKYFNDIRDFDPSAIAIHPKTDDYYILSADHVLVVYSKELEIKEIVKLDKHIFTQPEGICFSPEGVMFISSEGDGDRGELFRFEPISKENFN